MHIYGNLLMEAILWMESGTLPVHDVFMPRILFLDLQEEDLRPIQIHGRSL